MRTLLLFSFLLASVPAVFAQGTAKPAPPSTAKPAQPAPAKPATPATAQPAPAQPAPAQPRRPARRAAQPAARSGIALTVTTPDGATLPDVRVELTGPMPREAVTDASGQANFPGLSAGTYRLRFSGDAVTAFERELTLRAGAIERLKITLTPAPAVAAAPAAPPAPATGPTGSPQLGSLTNLAERERNTKEPRREILLSCSGNTRNMLLVLTQEQPQRIYDSAEATYYVIAGEGSARVGALQSVINVGSFIAVPRGTPFSIARNGNRPLALLWTLSGEPCEQAR